jgi:putative membrane protein
MVWHDQWGWGWGIGGFLMMLIVMALFWGGVIALVVWAIRQFRPAGPGGGSGGGSGGGGGDPAMRVLEERYARGEIDEDEFRRRREVLRGGPPG